MPLPAQEMQIACGLLQWPESKKSRPATTLRLYLVLLLLTCLAQTGCAAPGRDSTGQALSGRALIDPDGQLGPADALARLRNGQGQVYSSATFYPTQGATAAWFWLDVPEPALREPSVLMTPYPGLNSLRLFEREAGSLAWREQVSGDEIAVTHWATPHLYPVIALTAGPGPARRLPASWRVGWLIRRECVPASRSGFMSRSPSRPTSRAMLKHCWLIWVFRWTTSPTRRSA